MIRKVDKDTDLAQKLLSFVESCSWIEVKEHIAKMICAWEFEDWETMFAAIIDGKIVGMHAEQRGVAQIVHIETHHIRIPRKHQRRHVVLVPEASHMMLIPGIIITHAAHHRTGCEIRKIPERRGGGHGGTHGEARNINAAPVNAVG